MDNQTDVSIKFKNTVTGEKKLEQYAQTLAQIKSVLGSIDKGAATQLEQSAKNTKDISNSVEQMGKNFNLAFNYTTLRSFGRGLSHIVESFSAMTSKSTAFLEDFNLFQVAFRGNYTEATKFVNKLSEMYGLDEDWLVKTTAQFKQLSNAMGLANETGEKVSKLMTQMAIDISSLYNIDVDRASSVLQSALAGQTKPIRALGGDITQSSLQQTLDQVDFGRQVSQLSYAEKRLLIIVSLTQQLSSVTNDWGRTLESPSNQIRIMNEQWQRLQRNVGNIFLQIIGKVLPYLNAVLMVLNEIAKVIAALFGFKLDDFDFFDEGSIGGVEAGFDDLGDSIGNAADKAKELKQALRGFDKLNVIKTPTDTGGGAGSVGGISGGISPGLMNAFNKAFDDYNKKLTEVQMKATKIRDKIMEWLGFTKVIDKDTGEVSFKFDHITGGTILGALAVGGVIYKGVSSIYKILKKLGLINFSGIKDFSKAIKVISTSLKSGGLAKLGTIFSEIASSLGMTTAGLTAAVAAFVAIGVAVVHAYTHIKEFRDKVNDAFSSVITLYKTIYEKLTPAFEAIGKIIGPEIEKFVEKIKVIFGMMYDGIVGSFSVIADIVNGVAKMLTDALNGDWDAFGKDFKEMLKNLWGDFTTYINKMKDRILSFPKSTLQEVGEKIGKQISDFFTSIYNYFNEKVIQPVVSFFTTIATFIYDNAIKPVVDYLAPIIAKIVEAFTTIFNKVKEIALKIVEIITALWFAFKEYIIKPLAEWVVKTYNDFKEKIVEPIINWIAKAFAFVNEKVITPIKDIINKVKSFIDSKIITPIKETLSKAKTWVEQNVINPIKEKIEKFKNSVVNTFKSIGTTVADFIGGTVKGVINGIFTVIERNINSFIRMLNRAINKINDIPGVDISTVGEVSLPRLKQGLEFVPSDFYGPVFLDYGERVLTQQENKDYMSEKMGNRTQNNNKPINATFIVQVGSKELAKEVITDLQDMAKNNGKPIVIGG